MSYGIHLIAITLSEKKKVNSKWEIISLFIIDENVIRSLKQKVITLTQKVIICQTQNSITEILNLMTRLSIQSVALNKMTGERL